MLAWKKNSKGVYPIEILLTGFGANHKAWLAFMDSYGMEFPDISIEDKVHEAMLQRSLDAYGDGYHGYYYWDLYPKTVQYYIKRTKD